MDLRAELAETLRKRLALPETAERIAALLETPPDETLGDYALPCFSFAKALRKAPAVIAQKLAGSMEKGGLVADVKAVGPYLNIFLDREQVIGRTISAILKEPASYGAGLKKAEKVMIEYSQPNTHKAFHVGHLRGTSIGEALARILRHAGHEVVQANYSGDTGMHVAKWLWCYMNFHKDEQPPEGEGALGKWLAAIYVEAVQRLNEEPEHDDEVRKLNLLLDEGKDKQLMTLWRDSRQWSIDELNAIYADLQAHFDVWWFEREMETRAKELARELLAKGIAKESDGAIIVDLEQENLGVWVLLRQDGTPLYSAKDLALAEKKFTEYKIDRSIYVIGKAQSLHMQQLFKTLGLMRFAQAEKCFHLSYEEVRLPEGKMSSRTGQNILYTDVKEDVFAYTETEIRKRHDNWDEMEIAAVVQAVGICALKFEMLYRDHNKPIVFDVAKVCDFEGDTGPYIQYTHARCNSILTKLGKRPVMQGAAFHTLTSDHEFRLAKALLRFPDAIAVVSRELSPGALAQYALSLAKTFNSFYHACKVIGESPQVENARALLVDATRNVLALSLTLLGIEAPRRM